MFSLNAIPAFLVVAGAFISLASAAECNADLFGLEGYGSGTTGGGNAAPINVTSCAEMKAAAAKGGVIRLVGILNNCGVIDLKDDTTLMGYGSLIDTSVLRIKDAKNVIVRNLDFGEPLQGQSSLVVIGSTQVWIDHNIFYGPYDRSGGAQIEISGSDLLTVSWNCLLQAWKSSIVSGNEHHHVTYHHNAFFQLHSQAPAIDGATSHFYSNCIDTIYDFGLSASNDAKVLVENNAFLGGGPNGSIITNLNPESEGSVTERNNEFIKSPVQITKTGHVDPPYKYSLDSASCICKSVQRTCGPIW